MHASPPNRYAEGSPKPEPNPNLEIREEKIYEGPHPYRNDMRETTRVSFPGAVHLVVKWDPQCDTEKSYDYITLKKTSGTGHWGPEKICTKYGFPTVQVDADEFDIYFYSDGS